MPLFLHLYIVLIHPGWRAHRTGNVHVFMHPVLCWIVWTPPAGNDGRPRQQHYFHINRRQLLVEYGCGGLVERGFRPFFDLFTIILTMWASSIITTSGRTCSWFRRSSVLLFFFGYTVVVYACVFLFNHYISVVDLALLGLGQVVEVSLCASMTHAPPLFSMVSWDVQLLRQRLLLIRLPHRLLTPRTGSFEEGLRTLQLPKSCRGETRGQHEHVLLGLHSFGDGGGARFSRAESVVEEKTLYGVSMLR
jgi:hypothetical protein